MIDSPLNMGRLLTKEQQRAVRMAWLRASMRGRLVPEPSLSEVRWSDDYKHVGVRVESGVLECGFNDSLVLPVGKINPHYLIYSDRNLGAASLLHAIKRVMEERDG